MKKNDNDDIPLIADELEPDDDEVTLQDELKDQPRQTRSSTMTEDELKDQPRQTHAN
jgi:hypothetical protein